MIIFSVAIDGPSGSGKSTVAKQISKQLGIAYLDTGAMYRAVALYCNSNNVDADSEGQVNAALKNIDVQISWSFDGQITYLNGTNVSSDIRNDEIGRLASKIAEYREVRKYLVDLQRTFAVSNSIVMDGRDIATNVLPDANIKIYLDASVETRSERRYEELIHSGYKADYLTIYKEIEIRDNRDKTREIAPLVQAEDAVYIDTSDMTIEEVIEKIQGIIASTIEHDLEQR